MKRPDLLIFKKEDHHVVEKIIERLGGLSELPFTVEDNKSMKEMVSKAVVAVECENSLWKGQLMPDYGADLKPQKRLSGKLGLKKNAVLPTIILKNEDRTPLQAWQDSNQIPIHIWHVFYDMAFGISFDKLQKLIEEGYIQPTEQVFQAPGGATTKKSLYKCYYHYGFLLGNAREEPQLIAKHIIDKNGHILPYVHFEGGTMSLREEALDVLLKMANAKN